MAGISCTIFLDGSNELQPDVMLGIPIAADGQTRLVEREGRQYVGSAPELVVEVAAGNSSIELNAKLTAYQRNGVGEYLIILTEDRKDVCWLSLVDDRFIQILPDESGLLKSRLFPGLWLDPIALLAGDLAKLLRIIEAGSATEEHQQFVARLAAAIPG